MRKHRIVAVIVGWCMVCAFGGLTVTVARAQSDRSSRATLSESQKKDARIAFLEAQLVLQEERIILLQMQNTQIRKQEALAAWAKIEEEFVALLGGGEGDRLSTDTFELVKATP